MNVFYRKITAVCHETWFTMFQEACQWKLYYRVTVKSLCTNYN
jgi:hypothetical protein